MAVQSVPFATFDFGLVRLQSGAGPLGEGESGSGTKVTVSKFDEFAAGFA
jgi:hypothetical protein